MSDQVSPEPEQQLMVWSPTGEMQARTGVWVRQAATPIPGSVVAALELRLVGDCARAAPVASPRMLFDESAYINGINCPELQYSRFVLLHGSIGLDDQMRPVLRDFACYTPPDPTRVLTAIEYYKVLAQGTKLVTWLRGKQ